MTGGEEERKDRGRKKQPKNKHAQQTDPNTITGNPNPDKI